MTGALEAFAREVGATGPVACVGGRTQWHVGRRPAGAGDVREEGEVREVRAPAGIVEHEPEEMTVRVRAGTPVAELAAALADAGQRVALPTPGPGATVAGVLAVGQSDVRRLGWGPVRDALLEARFVTAEGRLVTAGGPTVKNVSGFDLGRLLVGSLGTLGLLAEVVLRAGPAPAVAQWFAGPVEVEDVAAAVHRPTAVLWDGTVTHVLIEGHPGDVEAAGRRLGARGAQAVAGPPPLPAHRWSVDPATIVDLAGEGRFGASFVAELGVGTVHADAPPPAPEVGAPVRALNERLRDRFDPARRLNPACDPMAAA